MPDNLCDPDGEPKEELGQHGPVDNNFGDAGNTEYAWLDPLLLTAEAAADLLCIGKTTLWELVRRDRLRCVEFIATGFKRPIRRFRLDDLKTFVEEMAR
jgi:hypothetical protein